MRKALLPPMLRLGAGAVLALLVGPSACGKKEPPAGSNPPAPASSPSASTAVLPGAPGQAAQEFRVAAKGISDVRLYELGEATFLVSDRVVFQVDDKGLRQDVTLQRGFPGTLVYGEVLASEEEGGSFEMLGSWPDGAWIQAFGSSGGYDFQVVRRTYRWSKDHWQVVEPPGGGEVLRGVSPWRKGTAVALTGTEFEVKLRLGGNKGNLSAQPTKTPWAAAADKAAKEAEAAAAAASGSAAPEASALPVASAAPSAPPAVASALAGTEPDAGQEDAGRVECKTELAGFPAVRNFLTPPEPGGILAFESGEIFIASTTCTDEHKSWAVERFPSNGKAGTIDRILAGGSARDTYLKLVGRSPAEVYLYEPGGAVLQRFDGKGWTQDKLPAEGKVQRLSMSAQGSLWMVLGNQVFRRTTGGSWQLVALPTVSGVPLEAKSVAAQRDDAVWIVADAAKTSYVLTNLGQIPPAFELPGFGDAEVAGGTKAAFRKGETVVRLPFSDACQQPYVLLIEHCPATAKEFPEVADRLRGKPEFEGVELVTETSQKWTFLGATAPNVGVAKKVVEAVKGVANVDARLFCHVPKVKSRIPR